MDDRVGLGREHGLAHGAGVEQVERDRLRPERPDALAVPGRAEGADHLVAAIDELRDEPAADGSARSCQENSHRVSPCGHIRGIPRVWCKTRDEEET